LTARRIAKLVSLGLGPTILAMPEGSFMARDLPGPNQFGNRYMLALRREGVVQPVRREASIIVWKRGPKYESVRRIVERMV
jgi:hypothetical protein